MIMANSLGISESNGHPVWHSTKRRHPSDISGDNRADEVTLGGEAAKR